MEHRMGVCQVVLTRQSAAVILAESEMIVDVRSG
jgi:hypothetical protein